MKEHTQPFLIGFTWVIFSIFDEKKKQLGLLPLLTWWELNLHWPLYFLHPDVSMRIILNKWYMWPSRTWFKHFALWKGKKKPQTLQLSGSNAWYVKERLKILAIPSRGSGTFWPGTYHACLAGVEALEPGSSHGKKFWAFNKEPVFVYSH